MLGALALCEVVVKLVWGMISKIAAHLARLVIAIVINAGTLCAHLGMCTCHVIVYGLVNELWVDSVTKKHGEIVLEVFCIVA